MRIYVIGENDCARALRGLLRQAGFAVAAPPQRHSEERSDEESLFSSLSKRNGLPIFGYTIEIAEWREALPQNDARIHFDSVDCPLEANILRHVTALSAHAVIVDRPGGKIHSDRAIAIRVPAGDSAQQHAAELGILRGLLDTVGRKRATPWKKWFGGRA